MPKHIVRLIALLVAFAVVALLAKSFFTAESFYRYGHYRGDYVQEEAAHDVVFQTPRYCLDCHTERVAQWSANNHKTVSCEVCHGPARGHPEKGKLPLPADLDVVKLCTLCHEAMPERPGRQPQIQVASHNPYTSSGTQCTVCHNPHSPKLAGVVAAVTGSVEEGKKSAASCASCHGADGISPNDAWPNLAGQNAAYLVRILAAYKSGAEKDVMMSPISQGLSDSDIQNLATYYASLDCKGAPSAPGAGDASSGKALADRNCASCHGETGIGSNPAWPNIAGQKAGYLANMLKAFRAGLRKDPMMGAVTRGLSDTDIANLAAFYASQSCEAVPERRSKP